MRKSEADSYYEHGQEEMQGNLFVLAGKGGYDSQSFIRTFMRSPLAKKLDSEYDFLQWAGKEYIFECLEEDYSDDLHKGGEVYDTETLYWTGYVYRYWHFYTGESSREIYRQADAGTMYAVFPAYHCLDVEMAIDRLKETYQDKRSRRKSASRHRKATSEESARLTGQ